MELQFRTKRELRTYLSENSFGKTVGFVPTMGALHRGHLSLLKQAQLENDLVIISIFVNPTQFNNPEDLKQYPNTLNEDLEQIRSISDSIVVFTPTTEEMYSTDVKSKRYDFEGIDSYLEGLDRPGHFDGVGTIVESLLRLIQPTKAYFGEKDFQQLLIVKSLVRQLKLPIEIVSCPIIREANGLAMSSRNARLTPEQRERASFIYNSLKKALELAKASQPHLLKEQIKELYAKEADFNLNYFEVVDVDHFHPATEFELNIHYRFLIAVTFYGVRLIDNIGYEHLENN